jgi:peroxiredoxin Q/BCP
MGLSKGSKVPEFSLQDQDGNWFHSKDYLGKKPMVLFFYPKDNTPGCTAEVCAFRDAYETFTEKGILVAGISSDSVGSHQKFAKRFRLPFLLLEDTGNQVRRMFGIRNSVFNLLPGRETFVVDKSGKIVMAFNSVNALKHVPKALQAVRQMKEA